MRASDHPGHVRQALLPLDAKVPDGAVDAGERPDATQVEALLAETPQILVTVPDHGPELQAAVALYAWLGVRLFRVPADEIDALGDVLDMVASIRGDRPPLETRRGLA